MYMKDMSITWQAKDLVTAYDRSLEQQIVGQGSGLVCRDEELWKKVEGLLRDGVAPDTHCLGLDPLRVMEESLATAAAASTGRVRGRGGLQGLERAFEVLEQAALNLYLCPWREEYKVVKMYSGMFTHFIKPVLSMPQIEKLFGLLGYQPTSSRQEQLCLLVARVNPVSLDELLYLCCAFFLARCECRLLLTALGEHTGEKQWELSVVKERLAGNSLQVALENTKKLLDVELQLIGQGDAESDDDLYTARQENGQQRTAVVQDDDGPRSLAWMNHSSHVDHNAIKIQSNGMMSLPSSSSFLSPREQPCVSTLNCQLKASSAESDTTRSRVRQRRRHTEDTQTQSLQMEVCRSEAADDQQCSCLQSTPIVKLCRDCNSVHDMSCALLKFCYQQNHCVIFPDNPTEVLHELRAVCPQAESLRMGASVALTSSTSALSCLDEPKSIAPISYHDCCDLAQPDPQVLCLSCNVFHTGSCRGNTFCMQDNHEIRRLGECSCGKEPSRDPLVLCRYCGKEYCKDCWYRDPLKCTCGQTFDQSSSV